MVSVDPGNCSADYHVTFNVGTVPGGAVTISYTWHLANGVTVVARPPVTLKANSSQTFTTTEGSNGATNDRAYVTWSANRTTGTSNIAPVTIFCIIT